MSGRATKRIWTLAIGVGLLLAASGAALAIELPGHPGEPDRTFGCETPPCDGHKIIAETGIATSTAIQPDGKIVLGAAITTGPSQILRLLPNGSLDTDFASAGIATFASDSNFRRVAVLDDGSLVAAGFGTVQGATKPIVWKLHPDGRPVISFGNIPLQPGLAAGPNAVGFTLDFQTDDKILVGGFLDSSNKFVATRFNSDGTVDQSYGDNGLATGPDGLAYGSAIQDDDKLVLAGVTGPSGRGEFRVARFSTDGTLDETFGCESPPCRGFVTGPDGPDVLTPDGVTSVAVTDDGKIVLASNNGATDGTQQLLVAQYTPNGVLDESFGCGTPPCDGFVLGATGVVNGDGMVIQPDGKILVTGATTNLGRSRVLLQRFNSDGTPDVTFGCAIPPCQSFVLAPMGAGFGIALQPDGKIVISGSQRLIGSNTNFLIARYLNDLPDHAIDVQSIKGHLGKGELVASGVADELSLHDGAIVRVTDRAGLVGLVSFEGSECSTRGNGRTDCANEAAQLTLTRSGQRVRFTVKLWDVELKNHVAEPLILRVVDSNTEIFEGAAESCDVRGNRLICR